MKHLSAAIILCGLIATTNSFAQEAEVTPEAEQTMSTLEMEENIARAERKTKVLEKEQNRAARRLKKQEKYLEAIADSEKDITKLKGKYGKLEAKLEKGQAKGKFSPNDISKMTDKLLDISEKITREEGKLQKLARRA